MSSIRTKGVDRPAELAAPVDPARTELLERLRGPQGEVIRADLLDQLASLGRRLAQEASQLQAAPRMRQIEAARLAVQTASAILGRIRVESPSPTDGHLPAPQHPFRGASHDQ
jgi:hypothetical protein